MKKIKKIGLRICCLTFCCITFCCLQNCRAQELKAHVSINTKSIQGGDNALFTKLEQEMTAFLNERRWSNYQFKQEEKINCNVQLILDSKEGTGARTRVHVETTDGFNRWDTVGVSENVTEASYIALVDSILFGLLLNDVPALNEE